MSTLRLPSRKTIIAKAKEDTEFTPHRPSDMSNQHWNLINQQFTGFVYGAEWMKRQAALGARRARPKGAVRSSSANGAKRTPKRTGASRATPKKKK